MKKIYLIIIVSFLFLKTSSAQKQYNVWYFGANAGIDFNSGAPYAITNGAMNTSEGCSSICDTGGNILFYTDGSTIWNRNNVAMPNGTGLSGNSTSTQSGLIVKQPGNPNLYYVFTNYITLNYSVVDMTLNGGLGDVTATKNVFMINSAEKLCGTKHANGADVWIVMHEGGTNGFNAFLLDSSGVNLTPVHSSDGMVANYNYGQMKISTDGSKIAFGVYNPDSTIYLGNFNNTTGVVSGGFSIPTSYSQTYGIEFSADGTKLYGSANPGIYQVYQFNLNAGSHAAIIASSTLVGNTISYDATGMQLGPDKKIYVCDDDNTYLDVINDPDSIGTACSYVHNALYLAGMSCQLGLPDCVYNNFALAPPPIAAFESSDSTLCENDCINFTDLSTNATSWQWAFEGAADSTSTAQNPQSVCYLTAGNYKVTLIASNSGGTDTLTFTNFIHVSAAPPTPVITQSGDTLFCSTDPSYSSYQWYADTALVPGTTDTLYIASQTGNYNVKVSNASGCNTAVGIQVILGIHVLSIDNNFGFTLSPNPASTFISLHIASLRNETATISIMNMLGQEASPPATLQRRGENALIDVSKLPSGMYFLQMKTESGNFVQRFVKE